MKPTTIDDLKVPADPAIKARVLAVIDEKHGAFLSEMAKALPDVEHAPLVVALRALIDEGTLRQKEDEAEHDWEYVRRR